MSKDLPTVVAENYLTIAPKLTIKVVVLSNGQRVIPEDDMKLACEWLGVDLSSIEAEAFFGGTE
ncbi:hypothetical protein [Erwinia sp. V71]|uniref:hypothetical protein n=1 Tax=Erwinia sp. V71 TaxID=3369424 RepID=UPI003F62AABF